VGFVSLTAAGCEDNVDVTRDPSTTSGGAAGAAGSAGEPTAGAEPGEGGGGSSSGGAGTAGSDEPTAGAEPGEGGGGSSSGGVGTGGAAPGGVGTSGGAAGAAGSAGEPTAGAEPGEGGGGNSTGGVGTGGAAPGGVDTNGGTVGGAGDAGSDAGGQGPLEPSEVTRAEDCEFWGFGGANGYSCAVATIEFVPPLRRTGIAATVTTSLDDTYTLDESGPILGEISAEDARMSFVVEDDAVLGLVVVDEGFAQPRYAPAWIDLELSQDGTVLVDQRLTPSYHCEALTIDDWCWMSNPLTVPTVE